jgi:hypothetical protein
MISDTDWFREIVHVTCDSDIDMAIRLRPHHNPVRPLPLMAYLHGYYKVNQTSKSNSLMHYIITTRFEGTNLVYKKLFIRSNS